MAKQFVRKVVSEHEFNPDEIYLHSNGDMYVDTKKATVGVLINGKFKSLNSMSDADIVKVVKDNSLTESGVIQLIKDNSLTESRVIELITENNTTPAEPTGE